MARTWIGLLLIIVGFGFAFPESYYVSYLLVGVGGAVIVEGSATRRLVAGGILAMLLTSPIVLLRWWMEVAASR